MMSEFKREDRYLVIKHSDLQRIDDGLYEELCEVVEKVGENFKDIGIPYREFVVVEHDWPEYESVREMIQARVEGRPNEIERLRAPDSGEKP